jgi:putative ABC transport system substrate-binding protein
MRRRAFIAGILASPAAAVRDAVVAQQPGRVMTVGWLNVSSAEINEPIFAAFREDLAARGYVAGRNISFDAVHLDGQLDRAADVARVLVARRPDVIAAQTLTGVLSLAAATRTIPIVMVTGSDPIGTGLTASLARPSRNITGFSTLNESLASKHIDHLRQVAPAMRRIGIVHGERDAGAVFLRTAIEAVTRPMGLTAVPVSARDTAGVLAALRAATADPLDALIVNADPVIYPATVEIAAFAAERRLPASYTQRQMAIDGGLMAVAFDPFEAVRGAADYVARILGGALVADLPFQQPTRITFTLNMASARRANIMVPAVLLALADEVIE